MSQLQGLLGGLRGDSDRGGQLISAELPPSPGHAARPGRRVSRSGTAADQLRDHRQLSLRGPRFESSPGPEHPDQLIVGRARAPAGQAGHLFGKSGQRGTRRRRIHHPAPSETAGWSGNQIRRVKPRSTRQEARLEQLWHRLRGGGSECVPVLIPDLVVLVRLPAVIT
jgi:hypothetical protein